MKEEIRMTVYEIISIIIAGVSTLVAILSFAFSFKTKKKCDQFIKSHMEIKDNSGVAVGVNEGEMHVQQK